MTTLRTLTILSIAKLASAPSGILAPVLLALAFAAGVGAWTLCRLGHREGWGLACDEGPGCRRGLLVRAGLR